MNAGLRISRIHFPVQVLGPGERIGVWVQGCDLACHGCMARDTWAADGGVELDVSQVIERMLSNVGDTEVDGITISGGEPFDQPDGLRALLEQLPSRLRRRQRREVDVLVYSGHSWGHLQDRHRDILELADAVIPEPFDSAQMPGGRWRGSANQPLMVLSELGRERFGAPSAADDPSAPTMQVAVDEDGVWMIGVPRSAGDLRRLEGALRRRGVTLGEASWRP